MHTPGVARAASCALVLTLVAAAIVRAQAPALRLTGTSADDAVAGVMIDGAAAYPLAALARLGARVSEAPAEVRAVLFDDTLTFTIGSPFFRSRAGVSQLAYAVRRVGTTVYLPEQLFLEWLPQRFPQQLVYGAGALRTSGVLVAAGVAEATAAAAADPSGTAAPAGNGGTGDAAGASAGTAAAPQPIKRIVVVDPGHGGRDAGKIGPTGVAEKDVVLAIGLRLAGILRERGYEVHLTRSRDTLIALADRPRLANEWKGPHQRALFVSIHANSWQPSVRGFETYFLSDARTEDARRVAAMENAAQELEDGDSGELPEAELILNSLRNDFYVRASNDLAEVVQESLAEFHSGPDRGVKQAGFRVLVGALMPAVLVETAYMSNPQEARLLGTSAFQQKLAWGMAEAIDRFFAQHEHLWAAGAP